MSLTSSPGQSVIPRIPKIMIRLKHPKSEILSTLNDLEQINGFVFEDVLLMFMKRKLEIFRRFQLFKDN